MVDRWNIVIKSKFVARIQSSPYDVAEKFFNDYDEAFDWCMTKGEPDDWFEIHDLETGKCIDEGEV